MFTNLILHNLQETSADWLPVQRSSIKTYGIYGGSPPKFLQWSSHFSVRYTGYLHIAFNIIKSVVLCHLWTLCNNNHQQRPSLISNHNNIRTRQIWGIWKLRRAYSPETPNLGQNRWCFVPCDLEIWWMTLENNRASLLCCFKLCATFHSHRWIQTGVTVRKRPIWVKFDNF